MTLSTIPVGSRLVRRYWAVPSPVVPVDASEHDDQVEATLAAIEVWANTSGEFATATPIIDERWVMTTPEDRTIIVTVERTHVWPAQTRDAVGPEGRRQAALTVRAAILAAITRNAA